MTWTGDISKMGDLADRIADLATVPSRAAARVSKELAGLIEEEFADGKDPYGKAWKPLAQSTLDRGRTPPPLTDSGDMRKSVTVKPMPHAGVGITIDHPAAPHQTGWSGSQGSGPARPILPGRAMPIAWDDAIVEAVDAEMRRAK